MKQLFKIAYFLILGALVEFVSFGYEDYHIQPGDVLKISVFNEPELARDVRVSETGKISLPLVGNFSVGGLTEQEANEKMTKSLADFLIAPQVTIFIQEFSKIFVYGEVKHPGEFQLSQQLTLLKAISLAGGLTEHANTKKVKIIRNIDFVETTVLVSLDEVIESGKHSEEDYLKPGDVVVISESFL